MTSRPHRSAIALTAFALLQVLVLLCGSGAHAAFTEAQAMSALYYAKASYCEAQSIQDWTCAACAKHPSFQVKSFHQDDTTETQGFVGVSAEQIVVSFRGTSNVENWIYDVKFIKVDYPNPACVGCGVHRGFLESYNSLRSFLLLALEQLRLAHPQLPILVTGHSLGGAIAMLAAADIASHVGSTVSPPRITLYTFGKPRVGNTAFAEWVAALFRSNGHESYRITHKADMVPHVPPMMFGFLHVPHEVWYDNNGDTDYKSCNDTNVTYSSGMRVREDPKCSNSVYPSSIVDHLKYLGICTSCSCASENKESFLPAKDPSRIKWFLALDHQLSTWCASQAMPQEECMNSWKRNRTFFEMDVSVE